LNKSEKNAAIEKKSRSVETSGHDDYREQDHLSPDEQFDQTVTEAHG